MKKPSCISVFYLALSSLLFLPVLLAQAEPPLVSIITDSAPGPAAQHGMEKIMDALSARHISFEQIHSIFNATGKIMLIAGVETNGGPADSLPTNAEALAIQKIDYQGTRAWIIAGSDDHGLMYGELDVADRIGWGTNQNEPFSELRETVEKPAVHTRALALYTMNRAYWESRFYDEAYWRRYLDTLAQNRFNSLVVIFGYEDGGFLAPCYPYFFDVPEFPGVKMIGLTPDQQARNTAALNRLIAMAHARGINFTVGIWDHIYRGGVQNGGSPGGDDTLRQPTPGLVWGMNATNLVPYTQAALKIFLQRFPGVDGIQFRMHDESGLKKSEQDGFWKATFHTLKETAPHLPLELRAKGLTSAEIQSATEAGVKFRINTKYWMEQMGLPFHPMHINPQDQANRRHSYADLLVYPEKYQMKWQVWNGGTARIFLWGDPDYMRRLVGITGLYDSDGLEFHEPLATKMEAQPQDARPFDLLKPSARYYDYEFERYWHLFQVFGRISYNPQVSTEVWDREFTRRFGAAAPAVENALHRASWILPRIIASSYPYSRFPMTDGWAEKQHLGDLPVFAQATLSDVQLFENFDEEAQLLLNHGETARVRPEETSRWFAHTAAAVTALVADAEAKIGPLRNNEFDSTIIDLKMLANLALYHSRRIPAAVSYRLYDRTRDPAALDDAIAYERSAIAAWRQMVEVAGDTYAPDLMMGARSRGLSGNWQDELDSLESGLARLETERKNIPADGVFLPSPRYVAFTNNPVSPVILHQPVTIAPARQPLVIRVRASAPSGLKWVQVLYRSVNQTQDYQTLELKPVDDQGNYEGVIPADKLNPQFDLMYFIQTMDNQHHGAMYPDFNKETPYFVVRLER